MAESSSARKKNVELSRKKPDGKEKSSSSAAPSGSLKTVLNQSDWKDMLLMILESIGSLADGSAMALMMLIASSLMNSYGDASFTLKDVNKFSLAFIYVAVGVGSGAFLEGFCWARTAERQTFRIRRRYLQAVLWQDVGFFDTNHGASIASQVVSSISTDTLTIQGVLTEKIANFITNTALFVTAQLAALYLSWRLAIVAITAISMRNSGEAVSSIRTVYSYVGEERTVKAYKISLEPTLKHGIKQGLMKRMAIGTIGVTFAVWALQGWYGSTLIMHKKAKGGDVFTAVVCIVYGGLGLGGALINIKYFIEANIAASRIFEMIHRVVDIDSAKELGKTMSEVKGEVEFRNIDFEYPSRPGSLVLSKFNLKVMACQTVGLVGRSGSGKSTVINLLEKFYEPLRGHILLDGVDIKTLQLKWLRSQMGLVSQEPIPFATSIKQNICFGKEEASMEEVMEAAKAANAHNFICQLPEGYNTLVGQLGSQLSEGQKQRISIARALLRDPRILLLDEATSALDSHSEKAVQDALNQTSIGRTTIIVAHRLSVLRNADLNAVIQSGKLVESGSHEQLMQNLSGPYSIMVQLQRNFIDDEVTSKAQDTGSSSSVVLDTGIANAEQKDDTSLSQIFSDEKKTNQQQDDNYSSPSPWQLMSMAATEWKPTLIGFIADLACGLIQPLYSLCMAALLAVYFTTDHNELRSQTRIYCFAFLAFAVFAFLTNVIQHYYFWIMGESLTKRVREALFEKILTYEIEWFDKENNSSGAVCSRLATDATMERTLVADRLSILAQAISSATLAVVLGLILSWKLALVAISLRPCIIAAFYISTTTMQTMSKKILKAQNESGELASEAVVNHRIITAFCFQEKVLNLLELTQVSSKKDSYGQSWYAGFGLFLSQFITGAVPALTFWYGGRLLYHKEITYKHLFQTFLILVTTGRLIAETGTITADLSKGEMGAYFSLVKLQQLSAM
ncbi:hypothetical protein POTOM_025021 [Populus tomentosa]|uniref:Uncharacterized protein n=1 Tax=Populus tomentosa TaxID=118781 RepID=A0A8X7ZUG6_POPTO|nr:hypothetical protein POTOM_025021 [Populus tomentosa]